MNNLVQNIVGGEEIWIEHPVAQYHEDMLFEMMLALKKQPGVFQFSWRPFSLDSLLLFRRHLLTIHPSINIPLPVQTKGKRNGLCKEWVMTLKETSVFNSVVGGAFPQSWVSFGTGRLFVANMITAWVPPLQFVVTSTDPAGVRNSGCKLKMQSARMTNYGFDFTTRTKVRDGLAIKEYLAVCAFQSQMKRVAWNQQTALDMANAQLQRLVLTNDPPPPPRSQAPLLDHGLLLTSLPHAQRTTTPAPSNPPQAE